MELIAIDYFSKGKNLFPEGPGTDDHLALLIREIQSILQNTGFTEQVFAVGTDSEQPSIQSAIALITDAAVDKPYVILLGPEEYTEDVTLPPYVFLRGQGRDVTRITGRVVGPVSGVAGISDMTVLSADAVPALDCQAGTFRALNVDVGNTSVDSNARSIRCSGGTLYFEGRSTQGAIQVLGGLMACRFAQFLQLQASTIQDGGRLFFGQGEMEAALPNAQVWEIKTSGIMDIGYCLVSNPSGGFFTLNDGTLRFGTLYQLAMGAGTSPIDEIQRITYDAVPDAGQFFLQHSGNTTSAIAFNATALDIQNALNALPSLSAVTVVGDVSTQQTDITFAGADGFTDQPLLLVLNNTLEASSVPVLATVTEQTPGIPAQNYTLQMESAGNILAGVNNIPASNKRILGGSNVAASLGV